MTEVEENLLKEHRKYLDKLGQFTCVVCLMPKKQVELGRIAIFRPAKRYKLARTSTYITCSGCEKKPAAEIYQGVEDWLVERGHVEL